MDAHIETLLDQYRANQPLYQGMESVIPGKLLSFFQEAGIVVANLEHRIKTEESLLGKLRIKGKKYQDIYDVTDIVGVRVITFYIDDVDKVATVVERLFDIDWPNSVDKRKAHEIDSFGYLSLHYICCIPETLYFNPEHPEINKIRFEVQMRTVLQHAWANMNHDTGYKSGVEVPKTYLRNLSRLAGILELVDEQFSNIRAELAAYRRNVRQLVESGNLDEVPLDGDTFKSYLALDPFGSLNRRIASVNQAEILEDPLDRFLPMFKGLGCSTLGDVERMIKDNSEGAFQISCYQIALTDLDIISASLGPQNICIAYLLRQGSGKAGIRYLLDMIGGEAESNSALADLIIDQAKAFPFMNQK